MSTDEPSPASEFPPTALCRALGLPEDFLVRLFHEDDWSFLIKSHAFVEAALTHLLTRALRSEALADPIAHLNTSGGQSSKVVFAKALHLLTPEAVAFIKQLSELRNLVVHRVQNVSFNLSQWHDGLDNDRRATFLQRMTYFNTLLPEPNRLKAEAALDSARQLCRTSPKYLLWFNLQIFALSLHLRGESEQSRANLERLGGALLVSALAGTGPV